MLLKFARGGVLDLLSAFGRVMSAAVPQYTGESRLPLIRHNSTVREKRKCATFVCLLRVGFPQERACFLAERGVSRSTAPQLALLR